MKNEYIVLAEHILKFTSEEIKQMANLNVSLTIIGMCNKLHEYEVIEYERRNKGRV